MFAPSQSSIVLPPGEECAPGLCQAFESQEELGWIVPVLNNEAIIQLLVFDPRSGFSELMPFVIDTGSTATVVPRVAHERLCSGGAFHWDYGTPAAPLRTPDGGTLESLQFHAHLHILSPDPKAAQAFSFGQAFTVHVVDEQSWGSGDAIGLLGMDALSQLILVADAEHVVLWRRPSDLGPSTAKAHQLDIK